MTVASKLSMSLASLYSFHLMSLAFTRLWSIRRTAVRIKRETDNYGSTELHTIIYYYIAIAHRIILIPCRFR